MPPDLETGVVRQPARRSAKKAIPQRRRDAEERGKKFIRRNFESVSMRMGKISQASGYKSHSVNWLFLLGI
jgi:hypothetical protein